MQKKDRAEGSARGNIRDDIQIQSHEIPIDMLEQWLRDHPEVTASMLAKAEVDMAARLVVLGLVTGSGFDVRTKAQLDVPFRTNGILANIVKAGGFCFFEGTSALYIWQGGGAFVLRDLTVLVRALSAIKGAKGEQVSDIYFATPAVSDSNRLIQFFMTPSGEISYLNPSGRKGMTNVRFVGGSYNLFMGLTVDEQGYGLTIKTLALHRVLADERAINDLGSWNLNVQPPAGRAIHTLGRPKIAQGDRIQIMVELLGFDRRIYETALTIYKLERGYGYQWGEQIRVDNLRIPIGEMSGRSDLYVSSTPGDAVATLLFETQRAANPAGQLFLGAS